jgi:hypothetical protein
MHVGRELHLKETVRQEKWWFARAPQVLAVLIVCQRPKLLNHWLRGVLGFAQDVHIVTILPHEKA